VSAVTAPKRNNYFGSFWC